MSSANVAAAPHHRKTPPSPDVSLSNKAVAAVCIQAFLNVNQSLCVLVVRLPTQNREQAKAQQSHIMFAIDADDLQVVLQLFYTLGTFTHFRFKSFLLCKNLQTESYCKMQLRGINKAFATILMISGAFSPGTRFTVHTEPASFQADRETLFGICADV